MSYQQLTSSMDDRLHLTVICELHMLFMNEVNPQISVVFFARTRIILARAIFDEIHGVRSNFLHGLTLELKTTGYLLCARTFPPSVAGKGR